jgi:hypothetical protein
LYEHVQVFSSACADGTSVCDTAAIARASVEAVRASNPGVLAMPGLDPSATVTA